MKIKKYLLPALVCATFVAVSPVLRAQDSTPATVPSGTGGAPAAAPEEHHRGGGGAAFVDRLTKDLSLTPDQQEKLKAILQDQHEKMKALHDDTSLTPDQRKEKGKDLREGLNDKIKAILTPDQQTKFEQIMAEMKEHHGRQQAPSSAASPSASTAQ